MDPFYTATWPLFTLRLTIGKKRRRSKQNGGGHIAPLPRVIGEKIHLDYLFERSHILKYADYRRANPTPAESEFQTFLNKLNGGVLRRQFVREHVISGRWIVDFFFHEIRLAIEIDGSIHLTGIQKQKDKMKDKDAARFDITVLRLTNREVAGNKGILREKLRKAWRSALDRENKIIGKIYA